MFRFIFNLPSQYLCDFSLFATIHFSLIIYSCVLLCYAAEILQNKYNSSLFIALSLLSARFRCLFFTHIMVPCCFLLCLIFVIFITNPLPLWQHRLSDVCSQRVFSLDYSISAPILKFINFSLVCVK